MNPLTHRVRPLGFAVGLLLALTVRVLAQDTSLTLSVTDKGGVPISGAKVCVVVSSGNKATLTDGTGRGFLNGLPTGSHEMFVIRNGFVTLDRLVALSGPTTLPVQLAPGTSQPPSGVDCPLNFAAMPIAGPKITSIEVRPLLLGSPKLGTSDSTTNPTIRVVAQFDRTPGYYRVGEVRDLNHPESDLSSLPWTPYDANTSIQLRLNTAGPYGTRHVSMQVNSGTSESGASPARGDSIVLAPAAVKSFTLTGAVLEQFVNAARRAGYRFNLIGPSQIGNYPCPTSTFISLADGGVSDPVSDPSRNFTEAWTFEIFQRTQPQLMPFWKVKEIVVDDIFRPARASDLTYGPSITGNSDEDPSRRISYSRNFSFDVPVQIPLLPPKPSPVRCVPLPHANPAILSITLEGPSDRQPADSFFVLP